VTRTARPKATPLAPKTSKAIGAAAQRLAAPPAFLALDPAARKRWERAYLSSVVKSPALSGMPRAKAIKAIESQRKSFEKQNVTLEGTSDVIFGKGLTNLVQGQGPKSTKDVLGLALGVGLLLPPGKVAKGIGAAGGAARTTVRESGGVRPLLASETGSILGRRSAAPGKVPKAIERQTIRDKFPSAAGASSLLPDSAGVTRLPGADIRAKLGPLDALSSILKGDGRAATTAAGTNRPGNPGVLGIGREAAPRAARRAGATGLTARLVPRTAEAVDARIDWLEGKLSSQIEFVARGLKEIGTGKGERPSLAPGGRQASSFGEREQMIIDEWKAVEEKARKGHKIRGRRYRSWEEMAIEKYGAHTDGRGRYLGFDADNVNPKKSVQTDQSMSWYREQAQADLREMMLADATKGDPTAQAIVRAIDELESLRSIRAKNAGADLFPEDVPVGGYGSDLQVSRRPPTAEPLGLSETQLDELQRLRTPGRVGGSGPPSPPRPPVASAAELPGGGDGGPIGPRTLNETVQEAAEGMPEAIAAQGKAYSVERAARAQGAMQAYYGAGGGTTGVRAALGELKGALPVINHDGFTELTPEAVDHMTRQIMEHPDLRFYESIGAVAGLERAVAGRSIQAGQLALLNRVFPKEVTDALAGPANQTFLAHLYDLGLRIWNVPRTFMASYDLSAPFRQGLVAGTRHPVIFAKNFKPMVKAFGSEKVSEAIMEDVVTRANFPRYGTAKLQLTDVRGTGAAREEQFPGSVVDNVVGVKHSARAYSAFLNKMRVDVFDHLIDVAAAHGKNIDDPNFLKALGEYINTSTGRGKIPGRHGDDAAQFLNTFLFSPRLLASRLQILNPIYYARLYRKDPFVARQALQAAVTTIGGISAMVYLSSNIPGAKVGSNPLSSDFGKVRIGNTRVDFAGGFQPIIVLYSRLLKKKSVSSASGRSQDINGGFGTSTRPDVVYRFAQSKLSPTTRLLWDQAAGETYLGDPVTVKGQAWSIAPLNVQGAYDAYATDGVPAAAAAGILGSIGFGVGSYPDKPISQGGGRATGRSGGKPGSSRFSNKPSVGSTKPR